MAQEEAAKQFSFRLPEGLIARVEECREHLQGAGLDMTRTDVVRLLLKHALDTTQCKIDLLFGEKSSQRRSTRR